MNKSIVEKLLFFGIILFMIFCFFLLGWIIRESIRSYNCKKTADEWFAENTEVVNYKGHQFLLYRVNNWCGLEHSPDCACTKKETTENE